MNTKNFVSQIAMTPKLRELATTTIYSLYDLAEFKTRHHLTDFGVELLIKISLPFGGIFRVGESTIYSLKHL